MCSRSITYDQDRLKIVCKNVQLIKVVKYFSLD